MKAKGLEELTEDGSGPRRPGRGERGSQPGPRLGAEPVQRLCQRPWTITQWWPWRFQWCGSQT
jgi:hypothetical protein